MVLTSSNGLVGKIIESGTNYSKAQSILDSRSSVPAMSIRTEDLGVVKDVYPSGITIGRVKEIKTDANGLTKYAIIEPYVDFKHLDTLLVIGETIQEEK